MPAAAGEGEISAAELARVGGGPQGTGAVSASSSAERPTAAEGGGGACRVPGQAKLVTPVHGKGVFRLPCNVTRT